MGRFLAPIAHKTLVQSIKRELDYIDENSKYSVGLFRSTCGFLDTDLPELEDNGYSVPEYVEAKKVVFDVDNPRQKVIMYKEEDGKAVEFFGYTVLLPYAVEAGVEYDLTCLQVWCFSKSEALKFLCDNLYYGIGYVDKCKGFSIPDCFATDGLYVFYLDLAKIAKVVKNDIVIYQDGAS